MRRTRAWMWMAVLGLGGASPLAASGGDRTGLADLDLEALLALPVETVSTASKREQDVANAPASVTVITAQELQAFGYRTLAEVLDGVRGVHTSYDRNYTYVGIRGFSRGDYNARVLLLLDGHQLNDDVYDMAFVGTELPLDLSLVERIEVVRGPGSVLYGGNALFGVVNVITKRATRLAGTEVQAGAASAGGYRGRVTHAFVREEAEGVLSASAASVAGGDLRYPEFSGQGARGDGVARGDDWDRFASGLAKLTWGRLVLEAVGGARAKGVPTGSYGTIYDDDRNETFDARWFAELRWDRPSETVAWSLRGYYDEYRFHERYAYEAGDPAAPTYVNRDEVLGRWTGAEARATWRLGERVTGVAGAEVELHLSQDQRNRDEGGAVQMEELHGSTVGAVYANAELQPASFVQLVAGLRFDRYDTFGGALSPRLALLLRLRPATVVKALYGRAFRPPNAADLYYNHPAFWARAGELDPEVIDTGELILEQGLGATARATLVAYRYRIRDVMSDVIDEATGFPRTENRDAATANGLEAEVEWRWRTGAAARASYALQRATDEAGRTLVNSPAHLAKLHLRGPLAWRLHGGLELVYVGERRTVAGGEVDGHLRANVTVSARGLAGGALDVSGGLHNALDASYADPARVEHLQAAIEQDGRTFRVEAVYRF